MGEAVRSWYFKDEICIYLIAFRWDTAVHQTFPLFREVDLACEPIIQPEQLLLWLHGVGYASQSNRELAGGSLLCMSGLACCSYQVLT